MAKRPITLIILYLCGVGLGLFSTAGYAIPLIGSGSAGRAGAGIAATNVHEVYTSNPSTMAGMSMYSLGSGFSSDGNTFYGSVVDTKTSEVAGGIAYYQQTKDSRFEEAVWKTRGFHLSLAKMLSKEMSFGLTGRYVWFEQQPVGGVLTFPDANDRHFDMDAGLHYKFGPNVAFGFVFRNMFIDKHLEQLPLSDLVAGLAYAPSDAVALYADVGTWVKSSTVNKQWTFAVGAEYKMMKEMLLRAGFRTITQFTNFNALSSGMVLNFDSVQVAYSGTFYLNSTPLQTTHGISLTLLF